MNFKQTRDAIATILTTEFTGYTVTKAPFFGDLNLDSKEIRVTCLPDYKNRYTDGSVKMKGKFSILCRGEQTDDVDESANNSIVLALEVLSFLSSHKNFTITSSVDKPVELAFYSDMSVIYEISFTLGYDYESPEIEV